MQSVADLTFINAIVEGYRASDQETGVISYFGFVNGKGQWYIMRRVTTGSIVAIRYSKGESAYSAAWTARATQVYDYFDVTFK